MVKNAKAFQSLYRQYKIYSKYIISYEKDANNK